MKKSFIMALALVLVLGIAIGGTVAWLTATTDPVTNTFTVGDIDISLAETTGTNYKIVPGVDISKNPKVTVTKGSEDCYVFVKITETNWPTVKEEDGTTRKVEYAVADDWTQLTDNEGNAVTGVYYREQTSSATDVSYSVLANDKVTVSSTLTKAEVKAITTNPSLIFQAYAIQKASGTNTTFTPYAAWQELNKAA